MFTHMPGTQAHQDKQTKTYLALSDLQQSQNSPHHADWIVTLAFYKVFHAVDSYFAELEIHPRSHREKNRCVQEYLGSIHRQYSALYRASRRARYEDFTFQDAPQEVESLVNRSLSIERYVNTLLEGH